MSRLPSQKRREQLIEATIDLAVAEGLPAASVRRIAEKANVSLGVVHYHFSSKDDLLSAMAAAFLEPTLHALAEVVEGARDGAGHPGSAALDAFWESLHQDPGRRLLGYELIPWSVRGTGEVARVLVTYQTEFVARLLANGLELAGTDGLHVTTLARMILAACEGVTLSWLADRDDALARQVLEHLVRAILTLAPPAKNPNRPRPLQETVA